MKICLGRLPVRCLKLRHGHIIVAGRTGSGKTNTVKVIVEEVLRRGAKVMALDWAGEYKMLEQLVPGENLRFNMVSGTLPEPQQYASFITDVFSTIYGLTEPQSYLLYKASKRLKAPYRLADLVAAVEGIEVRNYREVDIKAALLRRLEPLSDGVLGRTLNGSRPPTSLFQENVSIRLDKLYSIRERVLLSLIILRHLYDYMTLGGFRDSIVHFTILEEAWNLIPYRRREEPPTIGERIFLELRKYGECIVAVTQSLRDISERALRNASTIILHPSPVSEIRLLGLTLSQQPRKTGEALVIREDGATALLKIRKSRDKNVGRVDSLHGKGIIAEKAV